MEGAGFRYYKWMCMLDGVTRDTHRSMNGLVCKWEDDTVYSDDGGKTWKKRTGSMFIGQPGQDYNCRCTAIPFDPELEDDYEVKEMPEEKPEEKEPTPLEKAREETEKALERAENAEKQNLKNEIKIEKMSSYIDDIRKKAAESLARSYFPDEKWISEDGVMISLGRISQSKESKNAKAVFEKEKAVAKTLSKEKYNVWMGPENKKGQSNPDSIIDGLFFDFKECNLKKIEERFIEGFEQAGNVVIKIETKESLPRILGKLRTHARKRSGFLILILDEKVLKFNFMDI